jgi:hypothetical protein
VELRKASPQAARTLSSAQLRAKSKVEGSRFIDWKG